jgi:putative transposase
MRRHASHWTRMGYHKLLDFVRADGFAINHKRFYRLYKAEGLAIPRRRRRRKQHGPRKKLSLPERINQRWSMDFMSDQLVTGRRVRALNVVDDKSRECLRIEVGTSLTGLQVARVLDRLLETRGKPDVIVVDNGPEFTSHALADWSGRNGVEIHFIDPGKPNQNAFVESFNAIMRNECLNEHWFLDLSDMRRSVEAWRHKYNNLRPHGSLGKITPTEYSRRAGLTQAVEE